jgi:hypothetical protein
LENEQRLLTEVKVPGYIYKNLFTNHDVENDELVFDGGDCDILQYSLQAVFIGTGFQLWKGNTLLKWMKLIHIAGLPLVVLIILFLSSLLM